MITNALLFYIRILILAVLDVVQILKPFILFFYDGPLLCCDLTTYLSQLTNTNTI